MKLIRRLDNHRNKKLFAWIINIHSVKRNNKVVSWNMKKIFGVALPISKGINFLINSLYNAFAGVGPCLLLYFGD